MIINTGASMMIARLDINRGLPKILPTWPNALQVVSGETLLIFKGALIELTLRQ
jgi:hypothetical protein